MLFDHLLHPLVQKRPVAVMVRSCFEYAFAAADLDALFAEVTDRQYHRQLLFSSLVELLGSVVSRRHSSLHAAYRCDPERLGVSLASVYNELNCTEPLVSEAVLRHTAARLGAVAEHLVGKTQPFAGLQLKLVDGNYFAGTERRLAPLRPYGSAALPGMAVVVQDYATGLLTDMIASEDAYTNERSLLGRLLERIGAGQVVVADRNFCVGSFMDGLAARGAYFIIRHHAGTALLPLADPVFIGRSPTGEVYEQMVRVGNATYRSILILLDTPTRNGQTELRLLTNLPADRAGALEVAEAYRTRWRLEATFLEVTRSVDCELRSLGYPRAAILTFSLALCACNALRVVTQAVEAAQGDEHPAEEMSSFYAVEELIGASDALDLLMPPTVWETIRTWTAAEFAAWLLALAGIADWKKYRKTSRGPKKPVRKVKGGRKSPHRSTFRVLKNQPKPPKSP